MAAIPMARWHSAIGVWRSIDLSERSNQPLIDSELGLVLVFKRHYLQLPRSAHRTGGQGLPLLL